MAGTVKPLPTPASTNLDNNSENSEGTNSHSLAEDNDGRDGGQMSYISINQYSCITA